ncbi:hypothetical protein ACWEIJ_28900 [Lentzea sp. NPDC004789]
MSDDQAQKKSGAPEGYNSGDTADLRKALDSTYDYNKTLITLATATTALSATFLGKDLYLGSHLGTLIFSWVFLGCSMLAGVVGMGSYISQYAESNIKPRRSAVEYSGLVQVLSLMVGLTLLAVFAVQNTSGRTPVAPQTSTTNQIVSPTPGPTTGSPVTSG